MALPLDIQRVIQIIDQRIAVLQQTKEMILREFSDETGKWASPFRILEQTSEIAEPAQKSEAG